MEMNVQFSLFISLFLLLLHITNAFNITNLLNKYPDFSDFNRYLTQTNLAGEINSRQTITVLVVENGNLSPISGKPPNVLRNILSANVILDYYDVQKLQKLTNESATLTTLFQTSGLARGQQGFINITHLSTTSIAFGSAAPGSTPGSNLVKSVASQPYNISVLQVSNVIIPKGLDGPPAPSLPPSRAPRVAPVPSMPTPVPPPSPSQAPAPSNAQTPAEAVTPAATPGVAPAADAPAPAAPATPEADDSPNTGSGLQTSLHVVCTVVLSTIFFAARN